MVPKLVSRSLLVLSLFFTLSVSSLVAEGSVFKAYLCVKKLASVGSSLGSSLGECNFPFSCSNADGCKSTSEATEDEITIRDTWRGLGHCFFVLIEESDATNTDNSAEIMKGRVRATYSFGGTGKMFKVGQADVEKITIENGDVGGVELFSLKSTFKQAWDKFGDITAALNDEEALGYNLVSHNCCTAAFNAVKKVFASQQDVIDRTVKFLWNVNLGVGIKFKSSLKVIFSSSSSTLTTTTTAGVATGIAAAGVAGAIVIADAVDDAIVADGAAAADGGL